MEVGTFEAKTRLSELLDQVEKGEEISITRRGRVIARLVPAGDAEARRRAQMDEAIRQIRSAREGLTLGGLSIRDMIDEGRR